MTEPVSTATADPAGRRKQIGVLIVTLILAGALAVAIYAVWNYDTEHPVTDDARGQAGHAGQGQHRYLWRAGVQRRG